MGVSVMEKYEYSLFYLYCLVRLTYFFPCTGHSKCGIKHDINDCILMVIIQSEKIVLLLDSLISSAGHNSEDCQSINANFFVGRKPVVQFTVSLVLIPPSQ